MRFSVQGKSNKKQHFQISFSLPLWLTTPFENAKYQWRKWSYFVNPDHCEVCGKRMFARIYEIEHTFENGRRLILGNHPSKGVEHGYKSICICRECIVAELKSGKTWKPRFSHSDEQINGKPNKHNYRFWSAKQCDITGKKVRSFKDVEIFPYIDMTLCTTAWNHSYISKEAIIECAEKGVTRTSLWGVYKGKMHMMNHKRLYINDKGELL